MSNTTIFQLEIDKYDYSISFDELEEATNYLNENYSELQAEYLEENCCDLEGKILELTIDKDGDVIESKKLYTFEEWFMDIDTYIYRKDIELRCPEGYKTTWNQNGRFDYVKE